MIQFDLPKQKSSIIKVIGIGGGGSNAVNYMSQQNIEGVDFVICNTDAKAIEQSKVVNKIQLGPTSTQGLGAGANPEVGRKATEESLQEIKSILEVNTKMAFITAGMGGGTGTGGAPIVAQVCKELGILTVGIVTTPFSFEGPRRLQQAEEGIKALKPYVDTLLVISNDKLRVQYGNLKMREAFSKADDVLATASKCITDIINSRGHIIVDFADVCTVMKNGGVAVLGNSAVEGENRAQEAIEEALRSPLLNDSEIKGAKWILININSAEGDYECTMDEFDIISNYLRSEAGEHTDVIIGMGTDNSLDKKIGITLVATGFEHKDPFEAPVVAAKTQEPAKQVLTLQQEAPVVAAVVSVAEPVSAFVAEPVMSVAPIFVQQPAAAVQPEPVAVVNDEVLYGNKASVVSLQVAELEQAVAQTQVQQEVEVAQQQQIVELPVAETVLESIAQMAVVEKVQEPVSNSLFAKPTNVYASSNNNNNGLPQKGRLAISHTVDYSKVAEPTSTANEEAVNMAATNTLFDNQPEIGADEEVINFEVLNKQAAPVQNVTAATTTNDDIDLSEEERLKKIATDRINRLRSLSFNLSASNEVLEEFDTVPAYLRKELSLGASAAGSNAIERLYSNTSVEATDNNEAQLNSQNSFLFQQRPC